jgi:hypothetical protein
MNDKQELSGWLDEAMAAMEQQPDTTWTLAEFRIAYPSPNPGQAVVAIDKVAAAGSYNARAIDGTRSPSSTPTIRRDRRWRLSSTPCT